VKRIAELHGGHVGVNSAVGQGSRFWIRLPLSLAQEAAPLEQLATAPLGGTVSSSRAA